MTNVFDLLKERGLIAQTTHEDKIRELLASESVTFYIGFDPTADSLHVGHFLQLVVMAHMLKAGHKPIALLGGGTAMVGDPTGKTDMRRMMTKEEIEHNADCFKKQMSTLIEFADDKAIMVNNADWLLDLKYVEFLREVGVHFSVNKMLTYDCFKSRLEKGLSFIEFNYMLMQSYDFLLLSRKYDCKMELGGDDQWANILGGIELIRRVKGEEAYGMTFTLLTTSEGKKMGKTENGAVWLDPEKTSPYDFYQYWRNVADSDVIRCLSLLTFVPMDEIRKMEQYKDQEINEAKKVLAYEVTKMVHGEAEAQKAKSAAEALFGGAADDANIPSTELSGALLAEGMAILDMMMQAGLIPSKGEGRRLIDQGGVSVDGEKITDVNHIVRANDFKDGSILIKKGKKVYHKIELV